MMNMQQNRYLIRIVDDEESVRSSLGYMFEQEGYCVALYGSAKEFLTSDRFDLPGCAVLDVRMPEMSGLELQKALFVRGVTLPLVFLSAHGSIDMAVDTMQRGAVAFVEKTADRSRLMEAVRRALSTQTIPGDDPARAVADWRTLTPREKRVAQLIAQGLLNREVGERLGISPKTVQVFRGEVCRKLGVRGAAGITQAVLRIEQLLGEAEVLV